MQYTCLFVLCFFLLNCKSEKQDVFQFDGGNNTLTLAYENISSGISSKCFHIETAQNFNITCLGEGLETDVDKLDLLDYEHIEIAFDMNNDKAGKLLLDDQDYLLRFNYSNPRLKGTHKEKHNTRFFFSKSDHNNYYFECFIPWCDIQYHPIINDTLGFDILISDNDGQGRESKIALNATNDLLWMDMSGIGDLALSKIQHDSGIIQSIYNKENIIVDGIADPTWDSFTWYPISNIAKGPVITKTDLSAKFKTCWNESGISFLVQVTDDIIYTDIEHRVIMRDFGWIENSKGEIVWQMTFDNSKYAGGAKINRIAETTLFLQAGSYNVFYRSNDRHHPGNWYGLPPDNEENYGISLKKIN